MTQPYIHGIDQGGGGQASTDWSRYTLDQIWEMVKTEDGRVTYTQIDAWRRMAALCHEQADQLEKATHQLLQRWPARPGSASEAFSARVTTLVTSMRQAADAGASNQEPLTNITNTLGTAQGEVAALLETRRRYALADQLLTPQRTPSPSQTPLPAAPADLQRPPQDWRAQLDRQARTIMSHADATVGAEAARIRQPDLYAFSGESDGGTPLPAGGAEASGSASQGGLTPGSGRTSSASWAGKAPSMPVVIEGTHNVNGAGVGVGDTTQNADPILSGSFTPGIPVTDPSGSRTDIGGSQVVGLPPGSFVTAPFGAVLPPGGVIGARVSGAAAQASTRASTANEGLPTRSATTSPTEPKGAMPIAPMVPPRGGRPGAGTSGLSPAGRLGRGGRRGRWTRADSDDPWTVAEGGPTVLEPAPEPFDHDPGPGVIGFDR